jgi:hypothetical protein
VSSTLIACVASSNLVIREPLGIQNTVLEGNFTGAMRTAGGAARRYASTGRMSQSQTAVSGLQLLASGSLVLCLTFVNVPKPTV